MCTEGRKVIEKKIVQNLVEAIITALGQTLGANYGFKSEFPCYNVKMTRRSRAPSKNARPRAPLAAFGLPRPTVYGSPQALGAGIFARVPRPAMSFCPNIGPQYVC